MPMYYWWCETCQIKTKKICTPEQSKLERKCETCTNILKRAPSGPNSKIVEVLDNGLMDRKLERLSQAVELHKQNREFYEKKEDKT